MEGREGSDEGAEEEKVNYLEERGRNRVSKAEHFAIFRVEMLAARIILVLHNSAGPKVDIVKRYMRIY